jgi:hypothetical protein
MQLVGESAPQRWGVLVVRAWIETDNVLRARMTRTGTRVGSSKPIVAAGRDAILASVRDWLEDIAVTRTSGRQR